MKNKEKFELLLKNIIQEVMPSKDMQDYLCSHINDLRKWQIIDMISGALVTLQRKIEIFAELTQYEDLEKELRESENKWDVEWVKQYSYQYRAEMMTRAVLELQVENKEEGLLLLIVFKKRDNAEHITEIVPFYSYEKVMEYLLEELEQQKEPDECNSWYKIEKYRESHGTLEHICSYGLINGKIVCYEGYGSHLYPEFWGAPELNLPVPFRAGDIIAIDGRPSCEEKIALILSVGDNLDCCSIVVLYVDKDGNLRTNPLKHGLLFYEIESELRISPLYRVKLFDGTLEGNEAALRIAQGFIGGSEHKGRCMECSLILDGLRAGELTKELLEKNVRV